MFNLKSLVFVVLLSVSAAVFGGEKDPFVGWYSGVQEGIKQYPINHQKTLFAEVSRGGNGVYKIKFLSGVMRRSEVHGLVKGVKAENGALKIVGGEDGFRFTDFNGRADAKSMDFECANFGKKIKCSLKKFEIKSPTLGAKAPDGAIVLFDGMDTSKWMKGDSSPCKWNVENGAMFRNEQFGKNGRRVYNSIFTKQKFGAFRLHLEFKLPAAYSDGRVSVGNSGVYLGDYEIQIIDSFGSEGYWDECGALYRQIPPQVNAAFEVGAWQTFDIEYAPPVFDGEKLADYPRLTLYHNGVLVLSRVPCKAKTVKDVFNFSGFIPTNSADEDRQIGQAVNSKLARGAVRVMLQDHGDKVEFANIWLLEKKN